MSVHAGTAAGSARVKFLVAWWLLLAIKLGLAARLAPFVDEAFYAWEAKHLAWAYSDLPGLTAWLIWLGTSIAGEHALAMRAPFLLLAAAIPWQVVWLARRWFGPEAGWQAGLMALAMPLTAVAGVLAVPDVPLVFAALLAVDAIARLQQRVTWLATMQLALALVLGASAHYRFAAVLLAGAAGVLLAPAGRALLRSRPVWLAIVIGALAWLPLLLWNLQHGAAGLSFQLVERHPWQFHWQGSAWPLVQAATVTPGVFLLLMSTLVLVWRRYRHAEPGPWALLLGAGGLATVAFWPLALFVDSERLSLHWPHAGWLLLACAAPVVWNRWWSWARWLTALLAVSGVAIALLWLVMAATPSWRAQWADSSEYPDGFAGWPELSEAVATELAQRPGSQVLADNFKPAAQLAFALHLPDAQIGVLDHPLNRHHGRAAQLAQWQLLRAPSTTWPATPTLLVVEDSARPLKDRLRGYHWLCDQVGGLPPAQVLNVDRGRKRFLLFRLGGEQSSACRTPALAWLDSPVSHQVVRQGVLPVRGWAFKDATGLARVELTLDGVVVAQARYGRPEPKVAEYWQVSTDPQHPKVGFRAEIDLSAVTPGRHWLGLILHGRDGSREVWPEQPLVVVP